MICLPAMIPPLLHGRELWHAFGDAENLVFTNDQILFAIQFDFRARVLPDQHVIADLDVHGNGLPLIVDTTAADGDHGGLLGLFFRGVGDDDAADALLGRLDSLHEDAVPQWSNVHG